MNCQLQVQINGGVDDRKVIPCPRDAMMSTYLEGNQIRVCDIHHAVIKEAQRQQAETQEAAKLGADSLTNITRRLN